MKRRFLPIGAYLCVLLALYLVSNVDVEAGGPPAQPLNEVMGIPAGSKADPAGSPDNFLIQRAEYTLSYNSTNGTPNWVSWYLGSDWIGAADREDKFLMDPLVPKSLQKVSSGRYTNSGFDRGHMCPSKDRSNTTTNNEHTFYMTNMSPQVWTLNQQTWKALETYCRSLVQNPREPKDLFIVCGGTGKGGYTDKGKKPDGSDRTARELVEVFGETKGKKKMTITVPSHFWKVILVMPKGKRDPKYVNATDARLIGVMMENDVNVTGDNWGKFRVAVSTIEKGTGYKFFDKVVNASTRSSKLWTQADKVTVP